MAWLIPEWMNHKHVFGGRIFGLRLDKFNDGSVRIGIGLWWGEIVWVSPPRATARR